MKLPIVVQKEVNTYLYDSLPLCIILAYPGIHDWFLSHYLNLCSEVRKYDTAYRIIRTQYLEGGVYFAPRKDREVLEYNPIRVGPVIDIGLVKFLKENIKSGFYMIAFFDEYFLSCKMYYNKRHYVHESLIYGYDNIEGGFYAISFDRGRNFSCIFIPYSEAIDGIKEAYTQASDCLYQGYLHILKPVPSQVKIDYLSLQQQLKNYLNSTTALVDIYHLSLYNHMENDIAVNFHFGINVYDELVSTYNTIDPSWALSWESYMNFHLLTEHKRHVLKSLLHVNTSIIKKPILSNLLEAYNHIVNEHEILRMRQLKLFSKVSKYPLTDQSSFDNTIAKLQELKDREFVILNQIMTLLP
ncbi:MAG: hypothetical protein LBE13_07025 [Bacteroidales bacterium]|jgi:hypothetical protein|nr:hypothetical protein [Bacteroidales bacterium]